MFSLYTYRRTALEQEAESQIPFERDKKSCKG